MQPKPRLLKPRALLYYMRADDLREYRDELECMHAAGDNRQRVLDTYEYVLEVFDKRGINPRGRPKAMLRASAVYLLKAADINTMIHKLESKATMSEKEHNTLAMLRSERARRLQHNKTSYERRRENAESARMAICSTP